MGHMLLVVPAHLQVMPRLAAELQDQLNQKAMIAAGTRGEAIRHHLVDGAHFECLQTCKKM